MKKILLLLICFVPLYGKEEPAAYLADAAVRHTGFVAPVKKEMEEYFFRIREIEKKDISVAVRNYQKFIRKYGSHMCLHNGVYVTVARKVHTLLYNNPDLLSEYRKQFGPTGMEGFEKARTSADITCMEQNARLYFPSEYGAESVSYLASYYLDHGNLDRALMYIDMLRYFNLHSSMHDAMRAAIFDLLMGGYGSPQKGDLLLKDLNTEQPVWIGGVALSTVYPRDVSAFRSAPLVYHLALQGERVIVNTGRDIYCYDEKTGRHMWKPGPFHQVRMTSLLRGDVIRTSKVPSGSRKVFIPRAGSLALYEDKVAAALNPAEKDETCIVVCRFSSGKPVDEISGDSLADLLKIKGIELSWGKYELGLMPWFEDGLAYISMRYTRRDREQAFLCAYSFAEQKMVWASEMYETGLRHSKSSNASESIVKKYGPYVMVFSFAGYIGVFNAVDGSLVWQRFLVFPDTGGAGETRGSFSNWFIPLIGPGLCIIEGPLKDQITAYSTVSGTVAWQVRTGKPVWGLYTEKGLIYAADTDGTIDLMNIKWSTGEITWKYSGASSFPGSRSGPWLFCAGKEKVLKIDLDSGKCAEQIKLEGCVYPGSITVSDKLFLVNTAGIFVYERR